MRRNVSIWTLALALTLDLAAGVGDAIGLDGTIRPGQVWPDSTGVPINAHGGCVLFRDGTYYWFGTYCAEGEAGNAAQVGVQAYSSSDLVSWKNEGVVLGVSGDRESPLARGCILERPKVIYNATTGKFVMWFHLEPLGRDYAGALSGVAVADTVTGPYRFTGSFRPDAGVWPINAPKELQVELNAQETERLARIRFTGGAIPDYPTDLVYRRDFKGGQMARDMTLFVDDDKRAYQVYSSEENGTLHVSLLTGDYLRSAGRYARILPGRFNEAPAIFKHGGKYWMVTSDCTGWAPNAARLSVADSVWGPWTEIGNPWVGEKRHTNASYESQSAFFFGVAGGSDRVIYVADRWRPENPIDARYIWLPVDFERSGRPYLQWRDAWDPGLRAHAGP